MSDAQEDYNDNFSRGGRVFINIRFADNIAVNAEEEEEVMTL